MRHISEMGIDLIKTYEGFEKNIYLDAVGLATIGYGHLLLKGENEKFKNGLSKKSATKLLKKT